MSQRQESPVRRPLAWLPACALAALAACLSVLALSAPAAAAPGDLDPSFGTGGRVTTPSPMPFSRPDDMAVQPDGKIVVVGYQSDSYPDGNDFLAMRYDADGSLDQSFGEGGVQVTDFHGFYDGASSVAIQADGKIVVGGYAATAAGTSATDHAIVRYEPDGSLDASFGEGGKRIIDFVGGSEQSIAIALDADGKILLGGYAGGDFAISRLDQSGSLDPAFGTGGRVRTDFHGTSDAVTQLAVQDDGKILAGGRVTESGATFDFALARYEADGSLDASFGAGGKATLDFAGPAPGSDSLSGIAIQPDGKILASGFTGGETFGSQFAVARFGQDGSLDPGFAGDGTQTFDFDGEAEPPLVQGYSSFGEAGLALQPDGKIVVAGTSSLYNDIWQEEREFAVGTLMPDGSLDGGFGDGGKATVEFLDAPASATAVGLTSDRRIVVAGSAGGTALASLFADLPAPPETRELTVTVTGDGRVTGPGIDCPGDCAETYPEGEAVTLTATTGPDAAFGGWGGDCSGSGVCAVEMDSDRSVSASFAPDAGPNGPGPECEAARSALLAAGERARSAAKRVRRATGKAKLAKRRAKRVRRQVKRLAARRPAARKRVRRAKARLGAARSRQAAASRRRAAARKAVRSARAKRARTQSEVARTCG